MIQHKQISGKSSARCLYWSGLSVWNFYFLVKFYLLWTGYLNFHPFKNLVFLAFLLIPVPCYILRQLRNWLALPTGFALFWHDTWLPGPGSIMDQGTQLAHFSSNYLFELITRFINWQMLGAFFILFVGWLFLTQWIRITTVVVTTVLWINISTLIKERAMQETTDQLITVQNAVDKHATDSIMTIEDNLAFGDIPAQTAPPTNTNLNAWLNNFYHAEAKRKTLFPAILPADAEPFEILIINICSLSWADLDVTGLMSHPVWSRFDIKFKNFNSATSYSGPAAIRLLRASCGQTAHASLYQPASNDCYLFDNLAKLGFNQHLIMGHNGHFGDFLKEVRENGGIRTELMDQTGLPVILQGFDGSPVYSDIAVLSRWLNITSGDKNPRSATFYNTLPLHDGNHYPDVSTAADYKDRAQKLFDDLDAFFKDVEKSGRKVVAIVVPEHGAALKGDKMQISGLRDIPSPSITNVPVSVKFFGMKSPHQGGAIEISQPSSFLAISELIVRILDGKIFTDGNVDWATLTSGLPQTAPVSENANAIVIQYQNKPYVKLNGGDWIPYPRS